MRALRIRIKQSSANYKREETIDNKMTYPLPPYSTVIGALHKACGYTEYHDMKLSIQGSYGGKKEEIYFDNCFLNSLQNDRGILVKCCNKDVLSSGYIKVAAAKKSQGNDFRKGITIDVFNPELLDEYRKLKDINDKISNFKKCRFTPFLAKIKQRRKKLGELKKDKSISKDRLDRVVARDKELMNFEKMCKDKLKEFEDINYQEPISYFRTLTKGPKYYEVLYDIKLIIHIVAKDEVLNCIYDNIDNLTAIGRSEDFVDVEECQFTELSDIDEEYNCPYYAYIPVNIVNSGEIDWSYRDDMEANGTRYLLNKDYVLSEDKKKRIFNKKLVVYMSNYTVFDTISESENVDNIYVDKGNENYVVCLV